MGPRIERLSAKTWRCRVERNATDNAAEREFLLVRIPLRLRHRKWQEGNFARTTGAGTSSHGVQRPARGARPRQGAKEARPPRPAGQAIQRARRRRPTLQLRATPSSSTHLSAVSNRTSSAALRGGLLSAAPRGRGADSARTCSSFAGPSRRRSVAGFQRPASRRLRSVGSSPALPPALSGPGGRGESPARLPA